MTVPTQENQDQTPQKSNDKEFNFRAIEARLQQERNARLEAEKKAEEALRLAQQYQTRHQKDEDDDDDEPYVDRKRLDTRLSSFEKQLEEKIDKRAEEKARFLLNQQKQESWLRQNADFYDVMQHADKFADHDPELAETILQMPEGFERQKLVYKNIKALGLHQEKPKPPSIQEKIDANRRSPYYQPSNVSNAPYSSQGDFSAGGQKSAYEKMQQLKKQLRL